MRGSESRRYPWWRWRGCPQPKVVDVQTSAENTRRHILIFAATVLTTLLWLIPMGSAQAHSELLTSTPAADSVVTEPVTELVLEFNEEMITLGTEVAVMDPDGNPVTSGTPAVDGSTITQAIDLGADGEYYVVWRTVSADGHPISGEFTFTSDVGEPEATEEPSPQTPATSSPPATDPATSSSTSAPEQTTADANTTDPGDSTTDPTTTAEDSGRNWPWLLSIGAAIVVAAAAMLIWRRSRGRTSP